MPRTTYIVSEKQIRHKIKVFIISTNTHTERKKNDITLQLRSKIACVDAIKYIF